MTRTGVTRAVLLLIGIPVLVLGLWSFFAPGSFAAFADFPPYNEHLFHDLGAFQIGIAATVLLALLWSDVVLVVLVGFAIGSTFHLAAHLLDANLGGSALQTVGIAIVTALGAASAVARARSGISSTG